jgi:hypothetical protein
MAPQDIASAWRGLRCCGSNANSGRTPDQARPQPALAVPLAGLGAQSAAKPARLHRPMDVRPSPRRLGFYPERCRRAARAPWDCYGFLASKELDRGRMPSAAAHGLDAATVELARTAQSEVTPSARVASMTGMMSAAKRDPRREVWSRALERLLHDPDVELPG